VAKPALTLRPALIPSPTQPSIELILHSPLNDQPGTQLGELRQRLAGILANTHSQQLADLLFDLRQRRYGTSHGVGLLQFVLSGLEGTYAVASTAPKLFTALLRLRRDRIDTRRPLRRKGPVSFTPSFVAAASPNRGRDAACRAVHSK
jgi:hypothetical protein